MREEILEHLDFEKTNALLETFYQSTDFVTAILDLDGKIIAQSGARQICTDFHCVSPLSSSQCNLCNIELAKRMGQNTKQSFSTCMNGLIGFQIPLIIKGEHVANLYFCQFLLQKPDIDFFRRQATRYGFDERSYLEALEKVPIISEERVGSVVKLLLHLIEMYFEMTSAKFEQKELVEAMKHSQKLLFDSQVQLRNYSDDLSASQRAAHIGTWKLDVATNKVIWSEELYKLFGFTPSDSPPPYKEHMKLFTVESWKKLSTSLELVIKTGIPHEIQVETIRNDGSNGCMWIRAEAVNDSNNHIVSLRGTAQDITYHKQTEEALHKSEERFWIAQELSPDGFTILHPERNPKGEIIDFTWVYENKAIARITQTDPQEIIGKRLLQLFPAHAGTPIYELYIHVANTGEPAILEEIYVGEILCKPTWLRLVVVSMGNDIAIHTQDITERKRAENISKENAFRFQSLFNEMTTGAAVYKVMNDGQYGKDYVIQDFNTSALKAEGKTREEVLGKSLYDLRPNIDNYGLIPVFQRVWKTGEPACFPTKMYVDENFSNWYENHVFKLPSQEIVAIFEDVTEKIRAQELIKKQNDLFTSLLKLLPVGVLMVDAVEGKPLVLNDMGKALLGRETIFDVNDHNLSEVYKIYKANTNELYPIAQMPIILGMKGINSHRDDMLFEHPDGRRILLEVFGTAVNDEQGKPWASLVTFIDITDRKKIENELLFLSNHDHLTGLYNRRFFEKELQNIDTPENLPLSIVMCDVNGLKLINDSFGHDSGDMLLRKAARTIEKACRKSDLVARIGGDEFIILLPKTQIHESVEIANTIKTLSSKEKVANIELSISYGYDTKTAQNQSITEIIANAENHMYRYKLTERSSIRSKTIDLIMNALFEKSNREAAHSNRVSIFCQSIASEMKMDMHAVNQMKIAGLIHDIGKIGVDETILNKPGSLSTDERASIEKHPEIGWRLLSSTNEFSELARFVLHHHERWDGCGYPNGLKGEEIHIEARIIAVADAYDAMTSQRSYREALSKKEAIKELKKCSGTQFDPEIVEIFVHRILEKQDSESLVCEP